MNRAPATRPLRLSATSLSSRIVPMFDQAGQGSVLAAFARSCYVELRGRIVAVVAPELLNGPLNLVVPFPSETTLYHIPPGGNVAVTGGVLEIAGRLSIDFAPARQWRSHIEPMTVVAARAVELARTLASIRTILDRDAPQGSFARAAGRPQRAADGMARLSAALRTGDAALAGRAAIDLAGLGPGLTPSGDDVLAGALLAVAISEPPDAHDIRAQIMASVRGRTTRISEAYLAPAADGDAGEAWHTLIDLMRYVEVPPGNKPFRSSNGLVGDGAGEARRPERLEAAVRGIIAVGETSGADMLSGFVLGMTGFPHA
ncbi:MAG TPA: DUF2877 domain-containing protein [bacterium]